MHPGKQYALAVTCAFAFCSANAATINVVNPSFEDPVLASGASQQGSITGWDVTPGSGIVNIGTSATEGSQAAFGAPGQLSQTLAATLQANTRYTLQVDVGDLGSNDFDGYRITLSAGGSAITDDSSSLDPQGGFLTSVRSYDALPGDPFIGGTLSVFIQGTSENTLFDNVRLTTAPIPEPQTYALMLAGLGLVGYARFRSKRA